MGAPAGLSLAPPARAAAAERTLTYRLPRGARQGGAEGWYLLDLGYSLTFAPSRRGLAYLVVETDGRACAQLEFAPRSSPDGMRIRWSSVDAVTGYRAHVTAGRTVAGRFRNYLQLAGVRPGRNTLTFRIEMADGARVERLAIRPATAIVRTDVSPWRLALRVRLDAAPVHVGDVVRLHAQVANRGASPLGHVVIGPPTFTPGAFAPAGRRLVRIGRLRGSRRETLSLRALRPGRQRVALSASSDSNHPYVELTIPVLDRPDGRSRTLAAGAVTVGVALVATGLVWWARGRRR